jgi:hypothetical protein
MHKIYPIVKKLLTKALVNILKALGKLLIINTLDYG